MVAGWDEKGSTNTSQGGEGIKRGHSFRGINLWEEIASSCLYTWYLLMVIPKPTELEFLVELYIYIYISVKRLFLVLPGTVYGQNLVTCTFTAFFSCISNIFFLFYCWFVCMCVCVCLF